MRNRFILPFSIQESKLKIGFNDQIVLIGSCFSTAICSHFVQAGFRATNNHFGTSYNPLSIANQILKSIDLNSEKHIFHTEEKYLDWESASSLVGHSAEELSDKIDAMRQELRAKIATSSFLFITFGSAHAYKLVNNSIVVANCHKQPAHLFTKELLSLSVLKTTWMETIEKIKFINPTINICFTISPVRHIKDGIIENNRSKARLFELVTYLQENEKGSYFPSFEIVMDELRDYRFFKIDRIHPNDEAIAYIWERFGSVYFSGTTIEMIAKIDSVRKAEQHILIDPESQESRNHLEETKRRKSELSILEPSINW